MTSTSKACTRCLVTKDLELFARQRLGAYGRASRCKGCVREILLEKGEEGLLERREYTAKFQHKPESIWKRYKYDAKRRELVFELTLEEWLSLFMNKPCYYCNSAIERVAVDRLDNEQGYTKGNTVPCCRQCNFMKLKQLHTTFIEHCRKIAKHLYLRSNVVVSAPKSPS